ncbi:cytochrome c oxidase subunit II [Marinobacter salicampi]|uniref:cytochrome c oxidase subunit II n=1 Tax=Marinobacter salicampi TaxID=435907 RepID=UPI0014076026|nr:cytochrome c oxidase subunit II [Marinobacter salicampi]
MPMGQVMVKNNRSLPCLCVGILVLLLAGCQGPQSALEPSGPAAGEIALLWWVMFYSAVAIFTLVFALLMYAAFRKPEKRRQISPIKFVVVGGLAFPILVLSILLPLGIGVGSGMDRLTPPETLTVHVTAHQWWWEVAYKGGPNDLDFNSANELYIPVGQPVELILESADVIHSFWLPRLAGKRDMIPGMTNRLVIEADEPGIFRGQCAEFCGLAHAKMAFYAVALEPEEFFRWAENQSRPQPASLEDEGARLFAQNGCALCHTVRGHQARGREGPDLTHVGSRKTIGAGLLPTSPENIALWLSRNDKLKPGNRMPDYVHLSQEDRLSIARYLESLE